ncbi:MAG: hypothetical protein M3Z25_22995 [Actinomycetota bacterium]|nr:hypothetical protein [Actinomycetota bacterium]
MTPPAPRLVSQPHPRCITDAAVRPRRTAHAFDAVLAGLPALLVTECGRLGVDSSPRAVHECQVRGGPVVHRDVFSDLPDEGDWHHVLLAS